MSFMKKILFSLVLAILFVSCSKDSDEVLIDPVSQAPLAKIAQLRYDFSGVLQSTDSIEISSNKYISSKVYDENMNLMATSEWLYNSQGLLSNVNYFDANGITIPERTYSIDYDTEGRIVSITKNQWVHNFIYSSNLITETIALPNSQTPNVNTYHLDSQNRINQVDGSFPSVPKNVSVVYTDDNIISASTVFIPFGGTTAQMNTAYSFLNSETDVNSIYKIFTNLFGSYNNAILHDGVPAFEARVPAYYDSRLLSEINYSGDVSRVDRFDYDFNDNNILLETRILSDDVLRIKTTYIYEE